MVTEEVEGQRTAAGVARDPAAFLELQHSYSTQQARVIRR